MMPRRVLSAVRAVAGVNSVVCGVRQQWCIDPLRIAPSPQAEGGWGRGGDTFVPHPNPSPRAGRGRFRIRAGDGERLWECGGKCSATSLWAPPESLRGRGRSKAPSPLRSAGAPIDAFRGLSASAKLGGATQVRAKLRWRDFTEQGGLGFPFQRAT
ncbi:MAG: hypothetical protein QOE77_3052 [Blastocatellia bacterium]|nr:hypothetical protein [Blastocatellia bacterium]